MVRHVSHASALLSASAQEPDGSSFTFLIIKKNYTRGSVNATMSASAQEPVGTHLFNFFFLLLVTYQTGKTLLLITYQTDLA